MRLRIGVDGRDHEVLVEGEPPELRVTIGGRSVPVRIRLEGARVRADLEGHEILLEFGEGVRVDGARRSVAVTWLPDLESREGLEETVDVRPPMPGRIIRVLTGPGTRVLRGAPLAILEAMKMQNEIPAPVDGTVREVRVREGDAVTAGDIVVRIVRG